MPRLYCWLLLLYPARYREEFGDEMTAVFNEARGAVSPALGARLNFYRREFAGVLVGAVRVHLERFGASLRSFNMQRQFRFSGFTLLLLLLLLSGVVLAIAKASSIAGDSTGSSWRTVVSVLAFMLLTMCTVAGVVARILYGLRRSGIHRLENLESLTLLESNSRR